MLGSDWAATSDRMGRRNEPLEGSSISAEAYGASSGQREQLEGSVPGEGCEKVFLEEALLSRHRKEARVWL